MGYSIISALLIFYIVVLNCFNHNLVAKQVKTFINENRYAQHIISYIMLLTIILLLTKLNIIMTILYSVVAYLLYILTTKLDIQINIIIFICLLLGFLYEHIYTKKEIELKDDSSLNYDEKQKILEDANKNQTIIILITFLVTLGGSFIYFNRKQLQYTNSFSFSKFFVD
jgi:hypothetical protein